VEPVQQCRHERKETSEQKRKHLGLLPSSSFNFSIRFFFSSCGSIVFSISRFFCVATSRRVIVLNGAGARIAADFPVCQEIVGAIIGSALQRVDLVSREFPCVARSAAKGVAASFLDAA
jgi:hypothetical protein